MYFIHTIMLLNQRLPKIFLYSPFNNNQILLHLPEAFLGRFLPPLPQQHCLLLLELFQCSLVWLFARFCSIDTTSSISATHSEKKKKQQMNLMLIETVLPCCSWVSHTGKGKGNWESHVKNWASVEISIVGHQFI